MAWIDYFVLNYDVMESSHLGSNVFLSDYCYILKTDRLVLLIGPYNKAANAATSVLAFSWMGPKSTTSFILIVRSFTCRPSHDMGPIFYLRTDARPTRRFSNMRSLGLKSTTLTTRPR